MRSAAATGIAAAAGLFVVEVACAQGNATLEVDVADCVEIESPAERFRCYESRVDEALRAQSGSSARAERSAPSAEAEPSRPSVEVEPSGQREAALPASRSAVRADVARELELDRAGSAPPDDFGLRRANDDDEEAEEEERPEELFGTIAALRETVPNSFLITLENGQVWRQTAPKRYPLRTGHPVRIYPSRWGDAYRLTVEELKGFIQVERVR